MGARIVNAVFVRVPKWILTEYPRQILSASFWRVFRLESLFRCLREYVTLALQCPLIVTLIVACFVSLKVAIQRGSSREGAVEPHLFLELYTGEGGIQGRVSFTLWGLQGSQPF